MPRKISSDHPLSFLMQVLGFQRQELAQKLAIPDSLIGDCLRSGRGGSLEGYDKANRLLIESFGIRPSSVWPKTGCPRSLLGGPFTPIWYHAWNNTPLERISIEPIANNIRLDRTLIEPIAVSLARRALVTQQRVEWVNHHRTSLMAFIAENVIEILAEHGMDVFEADAGQKKLVDDLFWQAVNNAKKEAPVMEGSPSWVLKRCSPNLPAPTMRKILFTIARRNFRDLERFFPDEPHLQVDKEIF